MLLDSSAVNVEQTAPIVFLDSSVITEYLRGETWAGQLFAIESRHGIKFAVNPIVLQELLLTADSATAPELHRILEKILILPVELRRAESMVSRSRGLNSRSAHANDVLILSSAEKCDYFATNDARQREIFATVGAAPQVVTPRELVTRLQSA